MNIWFSSDFHYGHSNIVRGISKWENIKATRNFNTLEEHDTTLVENINKSVKKDDILYFLGDWSFGGLDNVFNFRKQINCKNIHFILGNHDHHIEKKRLIYSDDNKIIKLFSSINQVLFKKIGGQSMFLSHYSHRTWNNAHHGTWHLYGHSHNTLPDYQQWVYTTHNSLEINPLIPEAKVYDKINGWSWKPKKFKSMDIGIDTHPEFRPYHFDEITFIMKDRINLGVDHHNEKTT